MHIFQWQILLYLSFHLIGGFFTLVSVLGMPGNLDDTKTIVKKISSVYNALLVLCWSGIKWLFMISLVAFFFHQTLIGKILSLLSLGLGLSLFLSLVLLYKVK